MSVPGAAVLVSGAAGVLGSALVDAFMADGWAVLAGQHRTPVRPRAGPFKVIPLDVRRDDDWAAASEAARAMGIPLRMVVHNAGIASADLLARTDAGAWEEAIGTMTRPVWAGTRALRGWMTEGGGGHVLAVGSHAMRQGGAGQSAYASAKAAMVGACLSLASELAPDNIRVNVMLPGLMAGPMLDGLSPGERARRLSRALLGRANDPAEVARFAVFLATTHCVTGQVFAMDSRPLPWA